MTTTYTYTETKYEKDPQGKGFGEGSKKDEGKAKIGLLMEAFPEAIAAVSKVLEHGCKEYGRGSWRKVDNGVERYQDAGYRHAIAIHKGETYDSKTGLHNAAHKAWNALAELELLLVGTTIEKDRAEKDQKPYNPCVIQEYKPCNYCQECRA